MTKRLQFEREDFTVRVDRLFQDKETTHLERKKNTSELPFLQTSIFDGGTTKTPLLLDFCRENSSSTSYCAHDPGLAHNEHEEGYPRKAS